ncbi:Fe2+-dependent dioxygenase [Paracraurococcus lichenis]|uniref:Fe2+-dependent dioxygenase n=1 Tax=Paracraurococcus lichenis TaxID=3064888 RepID=A0ABT9E3P8_9PROT|nr:Fe2+-dependent dioxygenase [Paracraurococcus sp. LOR1-02]MDO9710786.1 Fe2+-dependent dioxygenase [Paracraurococcus sp. LOR1-02]
MLLPIDGILDAAALPRLRGLLATAPWQDGRATAGSRAAAVKANLQADPAHAATRAAAAELEAALRAHPVFAAAALPLRMTRPLFSRTPPGGGYGRHVDNALMGQVRTDLAWTLFLDGPEAGGALVVEEAGGEREVAPAPGLLVLYPATSLHRVEPVTRGERLVAFGWVQSRVRDAARRALLFDLHLAEQGVADAALRVQLARANLLRMWAEG